MVLEVSKMKKTGYIAIILMIIVLVAPVHALKRVWSSDRLLYDAVLGVETVKGSPDRLLVWGKNYERAEAKVALVEIKNQKINVIWESQNFYERGSNLMCAVGSFSSADQEVIVLAENLWKLYKIESGGLKEIASGTGITGVMEVTSGDVDGDGRTELIMTGVHELLRDTVDKKIAVYKYQNGKLAKVYETKGLGNIRALTSFDFTGKGKADIVAEVGLGYKQGEITVLQDYKQIVTSGLRPQPVFALSHVDGRLIVGDDSGVVTIYRLVTGSIPRFEQVDSASSVGWGLVDVASGDFLGRKAKQIAVISSPTGITIFE